MNDRLRPLIRGHKGVAELLGIAERTSKRWVGNGTLPPPDVRRRGYIAWRQETLLQWLESQGREQ